MPNLNTLKSCLRYPDNKPEDHLKAAASIADFRSQAGISTPEEWLRFIDSVTVFKTELYVDIPNLKIMRLMPDPGNVEQPDESELPRPNENTQSLSIVRFKKDVLPKETHSRKKAKNYAQTREFTEAVISRHALGYFVVRVAIVSGAGEVVVKKAVKRGGNILTTEFKESEEQPTLDIIDSDLKQTLLPSELAPDGVDFTVDSDYGKSFRLPIRLMD